MKCSGIIKAKQQKNNSVEEREHVSLFYPVKGVPGRDAHTHTHTHCYPDKSVGVCEGVRLDSMYYERTLPMNS